MTVELPLFTDSERRAVRAEKVRSTAAPSVPDKGLHRLFEEQATRTPEAIALAGDEQRITYAELNARANQLAHVLRDSGVGPEKLVALCLDRSPEMVIGILAILKAGGAYVPLDPEYPAARLAVILQDADPAIVLTTRALRGQLPEATRTLLLDTPETRTAFERAADDNPTDSERVATPNFGQAAYVIYTSGSTGAPKGVVVSHGNVVRLFESTRSWFEFGPDDVWTLFHSFAFDFSVWELWGALLHGGRLVLVPRTITRSPAEFLNLLAHERVTVLNQTPSAFYQLLQADAENPTTVELALRYIIFGGEALDFSRLRGWYLQHADDACTLVNMYGITETTVHVTYQPLSRELVRNTRSSLIGEAIPDLTLHVLDESREPTPSGQAGELYVGGAGLARGYLNRPELTAERFLPDPFSDRPGDRLYRTGDLVRRRSDGNLEYLGRIDQQVKLRGFRIELGEIESTLAEHPQITDCAVQLREDRPGDKRLVAYFVAPKSAMSPSAAELRRFLERRLPEHMLPARYVALNALPRTVNGKLDRQQLPAPESIINDQEASNEPKRVLRATGTPIEEELAGIFADVLGLARVGIHDNFFVLGGHSLLATTLVSRIRERLHVELSTRSLFVAPTPAGLARMFPSTSATRSETSSPSGQKEHAVRGPDAGTTDFLEVLRAGGDGHPLVCVGHVQPIPLLLERLPSLGPVIHLKLDGSQIWPPLNLTFEEQLQVYVRELEQHVLGRKLLLIGYSYGGILAYCLAAKLLNKGFDIDLMMIEPALPYRDLPWKIRLRQRLGSLYRLLFSRTPVGQVAAKGGEAEMISSEASIAEQRWNFMHPHYVQNIDSAFLHALGQRVALVAGAPYHASYAACWRRIETGGIESCVLPQTDNHLSCFQEPGLSRWLDFFEDWYRRSNRPARS